MSVTISNPHPYPVTYISDAYDEHPWVYHKPDPLPLPNRFIKTLQPGETATIPVTTIYKVLSGNGWRYVDRRTGQNTDNKEIKWI